MNPRPYFESRELIESLEPRRMLASFSGTSGVDAIQVFTVGTEIHVVINGVEQSTLDQQVTVSAGGGSDTVVLGGVLNIPSPRQLTVDLGQGDDFVTTHDFNTGIGSLDGINGGTIVIKGGAGGNDSMMIDDSNGIGVQEYAFQGDFFRFDDELLNYSDIETFSLDQNANASTRTLLVDKPAALDLTVSGRDGRDEFYAIGGDYEQHGWTVDTTSVFGGAGNDSIDFRDLLNAPGSLPLNVAGFTISRGAGGFTYSAIESQSISLLGSTQTNVININGPSGFIESTTIRGQNTTLNLNAVAGNTTVNSSGPVNIGGTSLAGVSGTITVNGGTVNVNDQADTGNDNYTVTATQLIKTVGPTTQVTINYVGAATLQLNANDDGNNINVHGAPADTAITINAGGGSDSIALGNGNIAANLLRSVVINGGAGSNSVHYNNSQDTSPSIQTLNGTTFTDGQSHDLNLISSIFIENGTGGGTLNVDRVATLTAIASSSSSQIVNIGGGNLDANLLADCSVVSATVVNIDDRLDTGNDGYIIDPTGYRKTTAGARDVDLSNSIGTINLFASDGDNNIQVNNAGNNLRIFANGGNDAIIVADTKPNFVQEMISVDTGSDGGSPFGDRFHIDSDSGTPTDAPGPHVRLLNTDSFGILSISRNGVFQIPTGVTGVITQGIGISGAIDFAGGALVMRGFGPTMGIYEDKTAIGYANGAWNGTSTQGAFNSSLAASSALPDGVGYAKATDLSSTFPFAFAGVQVNASDALFRYTLCGDADLNGVVNFDDYSRTDNGFINNRTGWVNGDFNYDNAINFDDYALIDLAFNTQGSGRGRN